MKKLRFRVVTRTASWWSGRDQSFLSPCFPHWTTRCPAPCVPKTSKNIPEGHDCPIQATTLQTQSDNTSRCLGLNTWTSYLCCVPKGISLLLSELRTHEPASPMGLLLTFDLTFPRVSSGTDQSLSLCTLELESFLPLTSLELQVRPYPSLGRGPCFFSVPKRMVWTHESSS